MPSLYITGLHPNLDSPIAAVKHIKDAIEYLAEAGIDTPAASSPEVAQLIDVLQSEGFVLLASSDDLGTLEYVRDALLRPFGIGAAIDPNTDRLARLHFDRKLTAEGATPEQVFAANAPAEAEDDDTSEGADPAYARAAMALLYATGGNPVEAARTAARLARSFGEDDYAEVIRELIESFPFIIADLALDGIVE